MTMIPFSSACCWPTLGASGTRHENTTNASGALEGPGGGYTWKTRVRKQETSVPSTLLHIYKSNNQYQKPTSHTATQKNILQKTARRPKNPDQRPLLSPGLGMLDWLHLYVSCGVIKHREETQRRYYLFCKKKKNGKETTKGKK